MTRTKFIALVVINVGVFIATAAFLPHTSVYSFTGPVSHFINSRQNWEVPWLVTVASTCITTGLVLILSRQSRGEG